MSYQMPASELIAVLGLDPQLLGGSDPMIQSLTLDSRKADEGSLFLAYPGTEVDGRDFVAGAVANGASLVLVEAQDYSATESVTDDTPVLAVVGLRDQIGLLADHFYRQPSLELQVFGVTGTNGKTTCCFLLAQSLQALGLKAAMIGTIGAGRPEQLESSSLTTPDVISVHQRLAEFRDQGITQVCMEVSSHALDQGRVRGVRFFCTLFTNLSHDHLDYHGDMQSYGATKQRLFTEYPSELSIINADDPLGLELIDSSTCEFVASYGAAGDVRAEEVELSEAGLRMVIESRALDFELATPLIGAVNVPNMLLLVTTLLSLSTPVEEIQKIAANLTPAPGRMQLLHVAGKPRVVIDYAHTPDALEKALHSVRQHCRGQLWCVFGCGGDRDRAKRPVMGAAAEQGADRLIVTNDNPRSESPAAIAEDIVAGIAGEAEVVLDRAAAIEHAIASAAQGDWVVIAGKGHETTQQVGAEYLPFSDREHVERALEAAA